MIYCVISLFMTLGWMVLLFNSMLAQAMIGNGLETDQYPEIVQLRVERLSSTAFCTATAVGVNTLLTAAHCLKGVLNSSQLSIPGHSQIVEFLKNPEYDELVECYEKEQNALFEKSKREPITPYEFKNLKQLKLSEEAHDIALLRTSKDFKSHLSIRIAKTGTLWTNLLVTLLGYGQNDRTAWFNTGSGVKRTGTNQISATKDGLFFTTGLAREASYSPMGVLTQATGENVGLNPGDSGGPMLDPQSRVIGVNVNVTDYQVRPRALCEYIGTQEGRNMCGEIRRKEADQVGTTVSLSSEWNVAFLRDASCEKGYDISILY